MQSHERPTLVIAPTVEGRIVGEGRCELSRKFVVGAAAFAERWPGRVRVCMQQRGGPDENLDNQIYTRSELPFDLEMVDFASAAGFLSGVAKPFTLLGAIDYRQIDLFRLAAAQRIPSVAVVEYSLRTRLQILRSDFANPFRLARRALWQFRQERRYRAVLRTCDGIQCNGVPSYRQYRSLCPNALLFYDNRIPAAAIPSPERLLPRFEALRKGGPLRLAFSGRLTRMKGVQHLPQLASRLREVGVHFRLDVFGDGPERKWLETEIGRLRLSDAVTLHGTVSFQDRLVPYLTDNVDLFICCHEQGDPACTYLETLGCGVPILGFANEAWSGMQQDLQAGWSVPLGDVRQMAATIARLAKDREQLAAFARHARDVAVRNEFHSTMQRRVEHLMECACNPLATNQDISEDGR